MDLIINRRMILDHSIMIPWCRGGFKQKSNARMDVGTPTKSLPFLQRRFIGNFESGNTCKIQFKWWYVDFMIVPTRVKTWEFMVRYGSSMHFCFISLTLLISNLPTSLLDSFPNSFNWIAHLSYVNTTLNFSLCIFYILDSTLYKMPPCHHANHQTSFPAPYTDLCLWCLYQAIVDLETHSTISKRAMLFGQELVQIPNEEF